jgi:hypothetical protein
MTKFVQRQMVSQCAGRGKGTSAAPPQHDAIPLPPPGAQQPGGGRHGEACPHRGCRNLPQEEPDQEIILSLLGYWHFDKFPTSKRGKICTIHAEFIKW